MIAKMIAVGMGLILCAAMLAGPAPRTGSAATISPVAGQRPASQVEDYLSSLDGTYGVSVVDLDGGGGVFVNDESTFPMASLYKLLVMYRVFQGIESGSLSPDDTLTIQDGDMAEAGYDGLEPGDVVTVAGALDSMITVSSNVAAFALVRAIGGWGEVDSAAGELGMWSTALGEGGYFYSTPNDVAHFFRLLAERSLVSPGASEQMIDLLLAQTVNDRIPALLPYGAQVAHKTGELGDVRNDGGIVRGPGGRYVVVVMSYGDDPDAATEAEAEISRMIYEQFGA